MGGCLSAQDACQVGGGYSGPVAPEGSLYSYILPSGSINSQRLDLQFQDGKDHSASSNPENHLNQGKEMLKKLWGHQSMATNALRNGKQLIVKHQ